MNPLRKALPLLAALAICLLANGCAGYRLGTMLPPDINSVAVPTFVNKTQEPLVEVETTRAAIEGFQKDGSLKVLPEDEADSVLRVVVTHYILTPVSYSSDNRAAPRQYRMTLFVSLELVRSSDKSVIARGTLVKGESVFSLVGDLSSAKLTALPLAAEDLAHNIIEKVVEAW